MVPAWFGKLACLGDFASRRLAPEPLRICDEWLSAAVAGSRVLLGECWLDTYLNAPLWRFAWAPGLLDERWWLGVMMPSCDNAGRYFPLLVLKPHHELPALPWLDGWYSAAGAAALATLGDDARLEAFEQAMHRLAAWPAGLPAWARAPACSRRTTLWWAPADTAAAKPRRFGGLPGAQGYTALMQAA